MKKQYKIVNIKLTELSNDGEIILDDHLKGGWELHTAYVCSPELFLLVRDDPDAVKEMIEKQESVNRLSYEAHTLAIKMMREPHSRVEYV